MLQTVLLQLLAQAGNIDGQGIVINKEIAVPELLHQVITRHNAARMLKEHPQNLKFILGQRHKLAPIDQIHGFKI